jgi:hypothetical protein
VDRGLAALLAMLVVAGCGRNAGERTVSALKTYDMAISDYLADGHPRPLSLPETTEGEREWNTFVEAGEERVVQLELAHAELVAAVESEGTGLERLPAIEELSQITIDEWIVAARPWVDSQREQQDVVKSCLTGTTVFQTCFLHAVEEHGEQWESSVDALNEL